MIFGLPIRVIPPIRRGGGIKSWNRILAYMVYRVSKWMGGLWQEMAL